MNLYLTGFMGSGKSTLGKQVAAELSMDFIELDRMIETREGMSVSEIFRSKGEEHFRKAERKALEIASASENSVIACGGGTPCFPGNLELMHSTGISVYLKLSANSLFQRLEKETSARPLLEGKTGKALEEHIRTLLDKREPHYRKATYTIKANDLSAGKLAGFIRNILHPSI